MSIYMEVSMLLLLGLFAGAAGAIIGAGGGFIIIPVLLLLFPDMPPQTVTSLSLAAIFFNSLSASHAYSKMKRIDYRAAFAFAAAGVPGAAIGAFAVYHIPRNWFSGIFGALMLIISIVLIIRPTRRESSGRHGRHNTTTHTIVESDGTGHTYSFSMPRSVMIGVGTGFLSSMMGIGGGIIFVPVMTFLLNFPVHIATATSHFALIFLALAASCVHLYEGTLGAASWQLIPLVPGVLIGAQGGAYLSNRIKGAWIIRAFAAALAIVGIRLLIG